MIIEISKPSTIYIEIVGDLPRNFKVYSLQDELHFFRPIGGTLRRIKYNEPNPGTYNTNVDFRIIKVNDLEIPTYYPPLPPFERNDVRDFVIKSNDTLTGTPARIFRKLGIIEKGPTFETYPPCMRVFILLHEIGHFYYKTEEYCDVFALEHFLKMGYNRSTAYYTLENVLHSSPGQIKRLKFLFNTILKTQKNGTT